MLTEAFLVFLSPLTYPAFQSLGLSHPSFDILQSFKTYLDEIKHKTIREIIWVVMYDILFI